MAWNPLRERRERRLAAAAAFRIRRRVVLEDVTAFGERLAGLHLETLTTALDDAMRTDYQRALDEYDAARLTLDRAAAEPELDGVSVHLRDGGYHLACVLARRDGTDPPARREPCFFDPRHGPAARDVRWTPPGGVEREVPVCRTDALRLAGGEQPAVRLVFTADGYVPWWAEPRLSAQASLDVHRRSIYRWAALYRAGGP